MQKNKYLLLIASLLGLGLLVAAAVDEHFLREWRRIQAQGIGDDGPIPVQLRQIVNTDLRKSDRCVSCHVTMAPGEGAVRGAKVMTVHKPVVHDPTVYGCTICHGGQGFATEKADAHGELHFWPEPMIPVSRAYAGCGTCHAANGVPSRDAFRQAALTYARLDCQACHKTDGRGGTIRPGGGGMEGPDLSHAGLKGFDKDWYPKHVAAADKATTGPWKTSFAAINDADREQLAVYLSTRVGSPGLMESKAMFFSSGCLGCHKVSGVGGDEGPDLSRAGEKDPGQMMHAVIADGGSVSEWMKEHFRSPGAVVAGSQMPALGINENELDLLTTYVLSLRRRDLPGKYMPKDQIQVLRFGAREFANDGATLYGAFCAGCHGMNGEGRRVPGMPGFPAIAAADFLSRVSDDFLRETVKKGRPGRRMPAWDKADGLRPEEIEKVVAHVRLLGNGVQQTPTTEPARFVSANAEAGKQLFAKGCAGCHGAKGEGGEGPALNNAVLLATAPDRYLIETITRGRRGTPMPAFGESSPVHRTLAPSETEQVVAFLRTWEKGKP